MSTLSEIERRRTLESKKRLVVSGEQYELYEYQHCFFYNRGPGKKVSSSSDVAKSPALVRREDNLCTARSTIRRLISSNTGTERLKFITYTFAKNVQSLEEAHTLWGDYTRRLRKACGSLKYISVVEFQKRGAVHYHVLYFNMPFKSGVKKKLQALWGQGWVKVIGLKNIKHVGAYVCKYLQKDILDSRLLGRKAYFCSKGLIKPLVIKDELRIDNFLMDCILEPEMLRAYDTSHYGQITYTQGLIKSL